ncbi:MAG TPA: SGNH/GDSL hydrolase family protein, partial [Thiolapillus brandeum]|nr:SGNH/GDSL hydrolase family protein [Thiolapillus brandeum]
MGNAGSANPVEKKGHILQRFITKTLVVLVAVILALLAAEFSVRFLTTIGPRSGTLKPALEDSLNVLTERTSTLTPGYTGILSGRDFSSVSIQVNAYGFRDPVWDFDTLADQRPYLFVGDSHFFGWGVEQEERISEQFAVQLKEAGMAAPVLNMSIPGWGTYQYLDVLEIHAVRVRPRVVILGFFVGNDFLDDITTVASHRNAGTGESTVSLFDTFNDQLRESLRASRVFNLVKYGLWNFQAFRHLFNTLEIHNDRVGLYDPVGGDWQDRLYSPTLEAFRLIAEFSNDAEIP